MLWEKTKAHSTPKSLVVLWPIPVSMWESYTSLQIVEQRGFLTFTLNQSISQKWSHQHSSNWINDKKGWIKLLTPWVPHQKGNKITTENCSTPNKRMTLDLWKQNTEDHNFTCRLLIRIITPNRYTREAVNTTTLSSPEVESEKSDKSCDL